MNQKGITVPQNSKAALTWYLQAAKYDHVPAIKLLAQMYEKGEGTKVDRAQAMTWLLVLANRGDKDARIEARRLRASMADKEWKSMGETLLKHGFDPKKVDIFLQEEPPPAVAKPN